MCIRDSINDHQVAFARNVAERMGTIINVEDIDDIEEKIIRYDEIVASMAHGMSSNNLKFNERLEEIVNKIFSV